MPIPISQIVSMTPGVIGGGGAAQLLVGMILTQDASVAPGSPLAFYNATDVATWFGAGSAEAAAAATYFPGVVNGQRLPYTLGFARYAATATPAGSYGATVPSSLAALQAVTAGTLIVTTGALRTSSAINLSSATSYAGVASLVNAAFTSPDFSVAYDAQRNRFTLLTTATGASAVSSDVSGTLAPLLGLSSASGAYIQSPGLAADTPTVAMNRLIAQSTNWASFTTAWLPAIADRLAFSAWNSGQNYRFWYVAYDLDAASTIANNTVSFGSQVFAAPYQGTTPVYGTLNTAAAFMGYAASIDFARNNGRSDLAFRQFNAGTPATCSSLATAQALLSNNYTYVGAYANAANSYTVAFDGKVSGVFPWADTYLDQIYLNSELQRAGFETLLAYKSIPYNADGYGLLYAGLQAVIVAALASGIIRAGVTLSSSQTLQVNSAAGRQVADVIQTRGWYLLITDATNAAQMRQQRTSPNIQFWYTDGGSIHYLNPNSIAII